MAHGSYEESFECIDSGFYVLLWSDWVHTDPIGFIRAKEDTPKTQAAAMSG